MRVLACFLGLTLGMFPFPASGMADVFVWAVAKDQYRRIISMGPDSAWRKKFSFPADENVRNLRFYLYPRSDSALVSLLDPDKKRLFDDRVVAPSRGTNWMEVTVPVPEGAPQVELVIRPEMKKSAGVRITEPRMVLPPRPARPPIILISLDTLRADHLPVYGYSRNTAPALTEFAAQAVVFEDATAPSPWTLPSHISMLTGTDHLTHQVRREHDGLPAELPTLAGIMERAGYVTTAITGSVYVSHSFLPDFQLHIEYTGDDPKGDLEFNRTALLQSVRHHRNESLFLFYHTFTIHDPYTGDVFSKGLRAGTHAETVARYDAGILRADRILEMLFSELKRQGLFDSAMIVVTSDHGEELADRGRAFYGHGHALYQEVVRVPLLIKFPGQPKRPSPIRVLSPVGLVDVVPTALDVIGLPTRDYIDGRSLRPFAFGPAGVRDAGTWGVGDADPATARDTDRVFLIGATNRGEFQDAIRRGKYKAIRHGRQRSMDDVGPGQIELYGLSEDPSERNNLVRTRPGKYAGVGVEMMKTFWGAANRHHKHFAGKVRLRTELSPENLARLRALGYLQ